MADNNGNDDDQASIDAVLVEIDFPTTRDELVDAARDADADSTVVADVSKAVILICFV
jgi:hypothetical protein